MEKLKSLSDAALRRIKYYAEGINDRLDKMIREEMQRREDELPDTVRYA